MSVSLLESRPTRKTAGLPPGPAMPETLRLRPVISLVNRTIKEPSISPTRAESEPVLRRAITETPRYDAEVVLS